MSFWHHLSDSEHVRLIDVFLCGDISRQLHVIVDHYVAQGMKK